MKSSDIFKKALQTIMKPLRYSLLRVSQDLSNASKQNPPSKDLEKFPRNIPEYIPAINEFVLLGRSSPADAINAVLELFPYAGERATYIDFEEHIIVPDPPPICKMVAQLCASIFFADCAAQLLTYAPQYDNMTLISFLSAIPTISFKTENLFANLISKISSTLFSQLAVIISQLSVRYYKEIFNIFNQSIKQKNANTATIFQLFQFLRCGNDVDQCLSLYNEIADTYKDKPEMWRAMRHVLHQVTSSEKPKVDKLYKLIKKYADKKTEAKGYAIECQTLIKVKFEGIMADEFVPYMQKIFSDKQIEWENKLNCFLIILQGGVMHFESTFWVFGDHNSQYSINKETKNLWNPTIDPSEITDFFTKNMKNFIKDENLHSLIGEILLNLGARSLSTLCDVMPSYIMFLKEDKDLAPAFFPILAIFTKMLDPSEKFTEAIKSTKPSEQRLMERLTSIKSPLQDFFASIIPKESYKAQALQSLSIYECANNLVPDLSLGVNTNTKKVIQSITSIDDKYKAFQNLSCFNISKKKAILPLAESINSTPTAIEKVLIHVICLLVRIASECDFGSQPQTLLDYIMKCAISSSSVVSAFALHTIQYIFIKKPSARNEIHTIILRYLFDRLSKPIAFTLLSLLNQLISLPYTPLMSADPEWFVNWANRFQAMVLMQLTNPFFECRYMACMASIRFQEVADESEYDNTIFTEIERYHTAMLGRVQARIPDVQIPAFTFPEICSCSNAQFFALYLSELCCISAQEKFKSVIEIILKFKLDDYLTIPTKSKTVKKPLAFTQSGYSIIDFNHSILFSTLLFRLQMWTNDRLARLLKFLPYLKKGSFIAYYPNIIPLTIASDTMLKKKFLSENIETIIKMAVDNDEWANAFISNFIRTSSPSSLSIVNQMSHIQMVNKNAKADKNEKIRALSFIEMVMDIFIQTTKSLDFQVLLLTSNSEMNTLSSVLRESMGIVCEPNAIKEPKVLSIFEKAVQLVIAICQAARPVFAAGKCVSLKNPNMLEFINEWSVKDRTVLLTGIEKLKKMINQKENTKLCNKAIVLLSGTPNIYDSEEAFKMNERETICITTGDDEDLVTILRQNPMLYSDFINKSLGSGSKSSRYATAVFKLYVDDENVDSSVYITDVDYQMNKFTCKYKGPLITLSLVKLTSYEYRDRYLAFSTIARLIPVFSALIQPERRDLIANFNGYLSTHKSEILSRAGPLTNDALFKLTRTICITMPFINFPLIDNALICISNIKFGAADSVTYISIMRAAAPYVDLNEQGRDFINRLLEIYKVIDSSIKQNYCDTFVSLGELSAVNRKILASNIYTFNTKVITKSINDDRDISEKQRASRKEAVESFTDAVVSVLVSLNIAQPIEFLGRTVQPLTFQSWFYTNVVMSSDDEETNPINFIDLSLKVINKILTTSSAHLLLSIIHIIIHFCLIHIDDNNYQYRNICVDILSGIINAFCNSSFDITYSTKFTFEDNITSEAISVKELVITIGKAIREKTPMACAQWQRIAVKWAAACGDLPLAYKSIQILSALSEIEGTNIELIIPLMRSLEIVHKCKADASLLGMIQSYTNGVLQYFLDSVLAIDKDGKRKSLGNQSFFIAQFTAPFIYLSKKLQQASITAIQILTEFTSLKAFYNIINIDDYASGIAPLFNSASSHYTLRFIAKYLEIIPKTAEDQKITVLCYILPFLYGAFCGFHCFDPYNSGLSDEFIDCAVNEISSEIIPRVFADTSIGSIFSHYFDPSNVSNVSPEDFLSDIAEQLATTKIEVIKKVDSFWSTIAAGENESNYTAIFAVTKKLIEKSVNPSLIIAACEDTILHAIEKNSIRSLDFLFVVSKLNQGSSSSSSKPELKVEPIKFEFISLIHDVIEHLPPMKALEGDVNLMRESDIPMVPLFEDVSRIYVEPVQRKLLEKAVFQPFTRQIEEFKAKENTKHSRKYKPKEPTAEELYIHENLKWDPEQTQQEQEICDVLPPEFFLVYDAEIGTFFNRINA